MLGTASPPGCEARALPRRQQWDVLAGYAPGPGLALRIYWARPNMAHDFEKKNAPEKTEVSEAELLLNNAQLQNSAREIGGLAGALLS